MRKNSKVTKESCNIEDHPLRLKQTIEEKDKLYLERAAGLFRALGDEARLRLLSYISLQEACVTEIAREANEGVSTISQRLKLLRMEGLVKRRREGKHLYYSLADNHILILIQNALEHVKEQRR
jgi:DNA-binding transcriptional ArsR family regulator